MKRKGYSRHYLEIEGQPIPLRLFREWRRSISFSITNSAVIVRVPRLMQKAQLRNVLEECHRRTLHYFEKHPAIRQRFIRPVYQNGDTLQLGEHSYSIFISEADRKTDGGKLQDQVIQLYLSKDLPLETQPERIRKLLSRLIAKDQLPNVRKRVHYLNQIHFQKTIRDVRLKYNRSNWGSCSSNGRINLSTRLLFAPQPVIDYVIIHELAHLIELNHSPAYWKHVARAMPEFQTHIAWLKEHGADCDF